MSGDHYYFGDSVTMHGGTGNTGMVKNQAPAGPPSDDALRTAVEELLRAARELRPSLPPAGARALDDTLPDVTDPAPARPQDRHRALLAVAGIAATVGTVGQPLLDAVNRVLELLGAG
ncbi:hypothetical protein [Streptomyces caatingaensis]|uniref:Uncharacterized protein n=1 Tax=Streptomyces caatingaensis TaxID=1678637 RepID=A0A0K9XEW0_9ACTN|nr:hypothetical protein [Streptomyces caatingaensis]KNB51763.1 hypothetical protein AC230_15690 [Streptomyces caatingaensis]